MNTNFVKKKRETGFSPAILQNMALSKYKYESSYYDMDMDAGFIIYDTKRKRHKKANHVI